VSETGKELKEWVVLMTGWIKQSLASFKIFTPDPVGAPLFPGYLL
jgi:hypothetical protein